MEGHPFQAATGNSPSDYKHLLKDQIIQMIIKPLILQLVNSARDITLVC